MEWKNLWIQRKKSREGRRRNGKRSRRDEEGRHRGREERNDRRNRWDEENERGIEEIDMILTIKMARRRTHRDSEKEEDDNY